VVQKMDIYPMQYSKALLNTAPESERTLYLMAGQLANDLNILSKLLMYSTNEVKGGTELFVRVNTAVAMLQVKQLAGRLNEGWILIQTQFNPLFKIYEASLSSEALEKLREIKKYFNSANLVYKIRNQAAFHSDPTLAKNGFAFIPDSEPLVDFLSTYRGHCLYYTSELVAVMGLIQLEPTASSWQNALDKIVSEVTNIPVVMTDFILGYMTAFAEKFIAPHIGDITANKFTIEDGPPADSITVPFFSAPPQDRFK